MMNNFIKIIKKYKYLVIANIAIIALTFIFPVKYSENEFISGTTRTGIILEPGILVSQKFTSKFDRIEKVSILASTMNKNIDCDLDLKLYDENKKQIGSKKVHNTSLKDTKNDTNISTDMVNYYLENPIDNASGKSFYVNLITNCDNIIKIQYYEALENEERAIYGDQTTFKKLPIKYSNSNKSQYEFLYSIVFMIISLLIILGGKNEKK